MTTFRVTYPSGREEYLTVNGKSAVEKLNKHLKKALQDGHIRHFEIKSNPVSPERVRVSLLIPTSKKTEYEAAATAQNKSVSEIIRNNLGIEGGDNASK